MQACAGAGQYPMFVKRELPDGGSVCCSSNLKKVNLLFSYGLISG